MQGPPPHLVDNDSSWLDFTDLVFVDPVGTGYSRAADGKDERDFFGIEHDTEYLADFIRTYLIDNGRMSSPVFLTGESYGGFRAVTITRDLQKKGGVSPSGFVAHLARARIRASQWRGLRPALLGALAPLLCGGQSREQRRHRAGALGAALKDAEHYALSDYLVALASGAEEGGKLAAPRLPS